MKKMLLMTMLFFNYVYGQTLAEWTRQKKTQIKYLVQQIAALQVYATYVEKGYNIAKNGLNMIGDIKKGDFNLRRDYFSSLKNINPTVKAYSKIAETITMQINIIKVCHQQRLNMNNSGQFNSDEMRYAGKVFENVLIGCTEIIDELISVTADGILQMRDDERIRRINYLYDNMQDRFSFVRHFANENSKLALQRMKEQNDVGVGKRLYGE